MEKLIVLSIWIAVVVAVDLAVTRPWSASAARMALPLLLGATLAAWVLATGFYSYGQMMNDGAWTGASIALGFVPGKAILLSLVAYAAARTYLTARGSGGPPIQRWALPVLLAGVTLYAVASDVIALRANALERHAANPALSTEEVAALTKRLRAGDAGRCEAFAFLGNPRCPRELLHEFVKSPDPYWRTAVARNDTISLDIATALASDPDDTVRYYFAFNRKLPPDILSRLAADKDESVQETVIWTDALSDEDFARLVNDPSAKARATAALHSRITAEQLKKLREDPEQRVRDAANRWGTRVE